MSEAGGCKKQREWQERKETGSSYRLLVHIGLRHRCVLGMTELFLMVTYKYMCWSKFVELKKKKTLVELYTKNDGFYLPFFLILSQIKIKGKNAM